MQIRGEEVHADVDEARAASTPNVVRWVLAISLFAAIVLLTVIWVTGAANSDQDTHTVDAQIRADEDAGRTAGTAGNAHQLDPAKPGASENAESGPNPNAGQ
jgi:hypothetical protein